jgi:hypothetical protein
MELQEVEVVIAPDGTTRVEVRGMAGLGCVELTADLENALGGQVVSREYTAEAYETRQGQVDDQLWRKPGP